MHDQMLRDILRRLNALERTSARVRVGEVTDVGTLDVALGGSDTSYEDVKAIEGITLAIGDQVATLLWGNDLVVLGAIGDGRKLSRGSVNVSTTAAVTGTATVTHGLGATPASVLATAQQSTGLVNVTVTNVGATTFDVVVRYTNDVAATANFGVYWIAAT